MAVRTRPETVSVGVLLAIVGGYLDAYTYVVRGGVFANAQTGNIVLLAVDAADRNGRSALFHVLAVLAFVAGAAVAEALGSPRVRRLVRRPTRVVLVLEVAVLTAVGTVPATPAVPDANGVTDAVVIPLVSFVAGLQVSTFRSLGGFSYSTMMTTADIRDAVGTAHRWLADHDAAAGRQTGGLAAVLLGFGAGATAGAAASEAFGAPAVWGAAAVLVAAGVAIAAETRALERRS